MLTPTPLSAEWSSVFYRAIKSAVCDLYLILLDDSSRDLLRMGGGWAVYKFGRATIDTNFFRDRMSKSIHFLCPSRVNYFLRMCRNFLPDNIYAVSLIFS